MRTATGNAILARLAASTMLDNAVNAHELEALYDTYNYSLPGITRKIYDYIRKCGISKVSKRTIKLAELAIDYFNNTERKIEMTDLKKLYIPCPMCDEMMEYAEDATPEYFDMDGVETKTGEDYETVTYACRKCDCSITTLKEHIEMYATMIAKAHGIYTDEEDDQPTPEEEEDYYNELERDESGE